MGKIDFEEVAVITIGTALGLVLGAILKGALSQSEFGAKLGLSEGYEDDDE